MKTTGFNDVQKQAVMDLLVLGMYADHNLASAEDACVQRLLDRFGFQSDYDRQEFSDAAFTRTTRHTGSSEATCAYATQLTASFTTTDAKRAAYDLLDELLTSDGRVTTEESQLLGVVKQAFRL